jgi:hypothetical protein
MVNIDNFSNYDGADGQSATKDLARPADGSRLVSDEHS